MGQGNALGFIWMSDVYLVGGLLFGLVSTGAMLAGMDGAPYYFSSSTVCQCVRGGGCDSVCKPLDGKQQWH